MYGQNNYGPQFGQGPRTPMPPANQQRAPALPPPPPQPPLQYQQGPRAPQPPVIQQTTYPIPPQIGQRGPYSYQNGFPAPPPTVQQSPSIAFHGMPNTGQSYLHPPPPAHGSTLVSQCYSNAQHNVQHPSHTGTQNLHPIPPPALVPPHGPPPCPDMLQAAAPHGSLPPPPPRPLPPPPPAGTQGLTLYKALYSPQSQTSGAEGLQHVPPPPPPPASNLFTPSTYGSSVNVTVGDSHVPPMDPLQQASRLPPSPSLPTAQSPSSSWPDVTASSFHCHPDFDHSSNKLPVSELKDPDSVDEVTASSHVRRITAVDGASQNYEGRNGFEAGSLAGDGLSSNKSLMFDLSSPPPKPVDAKINQKIEFLCQLIANNGPGTEDVTRQNESKNPEFEFLFGGAPGSGAAIAHEYFLWMKKRCMACKLNEGKNESPLKSLVIDSSSQPDHMMVSSGCVSLADSDMEMEDDITLPDRDQGVNDLIHEELDVKKQLHGPHSSPERSAAQGASCEKVSCSLSSEQCKGTNLVSDKGRAIIEKLPPIVDSLYSTGAAECPLVSNLENSSIPVADDQITFGAPAVAEANNSDRLSDQFIKIGSPFRLLQDYASDNSSENEDEAFVEDANVVIVPPSVTSVGKSSDKETGSHFMTYIGFESPCMTERESMPPTESRKSYKAAKFSQDTKKEVKDTCTTLISIESHEAFQEKDASDSAGIDVVSRSGKSQEGKKAKFESVPPKVDEFGRLIREGSSGSNSDDSYYKKRHNKRGRNRLRSRSRSRSRSPLKSRRRSPRRRREKRSRSRSWSSRNQRNRSRSPPFRRAGEFRDDNKRQDRGHIPECFDFLRGRCYRGASCRYVHHEYDKSDGSRRHRNKQPELKNSRIKEEIKHISVMNLHDEIKTQEMQICQDVPIPTKDGQLIDPDKTRCESSTVAAATMQVKQIISEKPEETTTHIPEKTEFQEVLKSHHPSSQLINGADSMKLCIDTSQDVLPFMKESIMEQPPSKNSVAQVQKANCSSEQMEDSTVSISEPLPNAILSTHEWAIKSANGQPISSEQFSSEFMAPNELPLPKFSAANIVYHSQLPPPPPPPSKGASAVHVSQLHRNYNMMPPHPLPNQHDQFSLPPDSSWTSLPPPPSRPLYDPSSNAGIAARGVSSQFQQNHLVPRNDIDSHTSAWPYPTELPSHSQVGDFVQQMYPPVRELPRPLLHREDFRSGNPSSQPFGGPGPMREDHFAHAPMQGLNSSNAFAHGNIHPQPAPSSRELTMHKMKNFSGDDFPKNETVNSSSQIHHGSQNQQPTYGMQYPVGDGILGVPGNSAIQYPKDLLDGNQSSCLPDFGVTTIPTHHHPYTATFEQPLSSKFSSNSLNQDKNGSSGNMFETSFIPGQVPVDGQGVGSVGSRQTTSSPSSARAVGQILRKSDGEQYDPLFDSFEPSLSPLEKHGHDQKRKRPSDSKVMVRLSGSFKPLDVEENNKHEEVGTVASATSLDNEEYGETADAEVGVVEDESPSDPDGAENFAAGEIEIDQVESSGKSKKKKDSRSMRLFKIAVADFVKEILKPSWRQGNMSKEAFKTIVKKTVDKVSGAMKRHQIPKSQAKINQYIDLSQRKLTKLVMGYVDKYVKV